jgi:hypothetical protein
MVIKTIPANDRVTLEYPNKMNQEDVLHLTEPAESLSS